MFDKASRHNADIIPVYVDDPNPVPPVLVTAWEDLIDRYQEKFMPAAAGVYSRAEYHTARQISSEDVGGWHTCLHNLYNRAYPGQEVDTNHAFIKKFVTQQEEEVNRQTKCVSRLIIVDIMQHSLT
jgi:hypothetical protein